MRLLTLLVAAFVLLPAAVASACPSPRAPLTAHTAAAHERAVRCGINAQRARHGLQPLRHSTRLARAAGRLSRAMVQARFFSHVGRDGSTVTSRARSAGYRRHAALGETIAWGAGRLARPGAIVATWMASPPHRATILTPGFSEVGLGVAAGSPVGLANAATVTADFGTRR
jgi:uncharacterized protein YkwD